MKKPLKSFSPNTKCSVSVERRKVSEHSMSIVFEVSGDLDSIDMPIKSEAPCEKDGLWGSTCFELFLAQTQGDRYMEWNISPLGHWANYCFSSYRNTWSGDRPREKPVISEPIIRTGKLFIEFTMDTQQVRQFLGDQRWQSFPCVILKHKDQSMSYWALEHLSAQPDFHRFK